MENPLRLPFALIFRHLLFPKLPHLVHDCHHLGPIAEQARQALIASAVSVPCRDSCRTLQSVRCPCTIDVQAHDVDVSIGEIEAFACVCQKLWVGTQRCEARFRVRVCEGVFRVFRISKRITLWGCFFRIAKRVGLPDKIIPVSIGVSGAGRKGFRNVNACAVRVL